jgi:hypothetical protein
MMRSVRLSDVSGQAQCRVAVLGGNQRYCGASPATHLKTDQAFLTLASIAFQAVSAPSLR